MNDFNDKIKKLIDEIERLKKEIHELKEMSKRREGSIGAMIDSILSSIPNIIEQELSKIFKDVDKRKFAKSLIFKIPTSLDSSAKKIEIAEESPKISLEEEIDKIIDEVLETKDYYEGEYALSENLDTLIKNIDPTEVSDAMVILANPDRIKLLQYLYEKDRYFSELEDYLRLGPSSLRHHLSKLINGGLISQERSRGKYSITRKGVAALILISYLYEKILKEVK